MNKWTYQNKETGATEEVELERWMWGVLYKDGTELHQFDNAGIFHRIAEVDQSKVALWCLYQPGADKRGRIDFVVPEGKEVALIHKYRHFILNAGTKEETRKKVYIFGYKVKGGLPHLNFVLPDDRIVQSYGETEPILTQMGV